MCKVLIQLPPNVESLAEAKAAIDRLKREESNEKVAEPNGYMTLKIELMNTKISRTIVAPEHITLEDLSDAIQEVMGWEGMHLWSFTDSRRDGTLYELPHKDDGFPPFSRRLTLDASKVVLRKVFPKRGAKMFYEYDFGDGWTHVVTRQADPKTPEIACLKAQGPDGIEDIGGAWRLADFISKMQTDPDCEEYADDREWAGLRSPEELKKYLEGRTSYCPKMLFRVEGGMVISEEYFPGDCEDVGKAIDEFRKEQAKYSRWYPETRADLFGFESFDSFEVTAESDRVDALLKKICGTSGKYEPDEALFATYNLLERAVPPESVCDFLFEQSILPKLEGGRRNEFIAAE